MRLSTTRSRPSWSSASRRWCAGDSAYADGETRDRLGNAGYTVRAKVLPARNRAGRFTKDRFDVNLHDNTVSCPAEHTVPITCHGVAEATWRAWLSSASPTTAPLGRPAPADLDPSRLTDPNPSVTETVAIRPNR
jgi:hypothetical protein